MSGAPNRLCTIDGVLCMKDGSRVQDYLRSVPHMGTNPDVVLISRDEVIRLAELARSAQDARFAVAG